MVSKPYVKVAADGSPVVVKVVHELSPEVRRLIGDIQRFDRADTWHAMKEACRPFAADAVLDEVGIYIPGKERIRVLSTIISYFVRKDLDPKVARIQMLPTGQAKLEVDVVIHMHVVRHWWLPYTYLVPSDLPVDGTLTIIVNGHDDSLAYVKARVHNVPPLAPYFVRWALGVVGGSVALALEPHVLSAYPSVNETIEKVSHVVEPLIHTAPAEKVKGITLSTYEALRGLLHAVVDTAGAANDELKS